eukprot:CAMPEP_0175979420 /NCGR_PEP_ID=MMETSP0108-20121206/46218_1 /TAXON_ID=195067 ORGANISM="Goniomonas pacifica, Strain CCMP1869" /NCGR_SAMPLE_ID=MMETSP0108 /ASSEMBLY_ACC=CAM_ASM_000204 /LENGTH=144 /DNA_ID=CAMNT_0017309733 /DNA_START=234 /DNA_END=668 /DNA_ORIENTATION=-
MSISLTPLPTWPAFTVPLLLPAYGVLSLALSVSLYPPSSSHAPPSAAVLLPPGSASVGNVREEQSEAKRCSNDESHNPDNTAHFTQEFQQVNLLVWSALCVISNVLPPPTRCSSPPTLAPWMDGNGEGLIYTTSSHQQPLWMYS